MKWELNQIQHKILKLSQENQKENKVFIKLMKLNVLIGMKHSIEMVMMTNLAIHAMVVPLEKAVSHLRKFLAKSYRVIFTRKKIGNFQRKGRTKILSLKVH